MLADVATKQFPKQSRKRPAEEVVDLSDDSANQPLKLARPAPFPYLKVVLSASSAGANSTLTPKEITFQSLIRPRNADGSEKTNDQILNDPQGIKALKNFL